MTASRLRLAYAGSPLVSSALLEALVKKNRHDIGLILTQPDRRAGRDRKIQCNPVKRFAKQLNIPVLQPTSAAEIEAEQLARFDLLLVVAYGVILPSHILSAPAHGCINVHFSLLPRWRGAAPIQHAILAGDQQSGVSIMQISARLDAGPVYLARTCTVDAHDTSNSLQGKLVTLAAAALHQFLDLFSKDKTIRPHAQNETAATYACKLSKQDAQIDWQLPAQLIDRKIRAFNPVPVAYSSTSDGTVIRIWEAELVDVSTTAVPGTVIQCNKNGIVVAAKAGAIKLLRLQPAGKKVMSAADFLNGRPNFAADHSCFSSFICKG